jgi:hypothetical protein
MRKPLTVALFLIIPLVLLGLAGVSQAQLVLYDNFNVKPINPAKWFGTEFQFGPANPDTEAVRKLASGKLYITLTEWGRTDSDSGQGGGANYALSVSNPAPITTIQADVTVKSAKVVGCAANTTGTRSSARILGSFFNDGTGPGAPNETGDILASIQSQRDSIAGDQIIAALSRCGNANCTTFTLLSSVVFTASWVQGVANTLNIQWDKPNKQFIYTLNPGGSQEQHIVGYSVSDANPPGLNLRQLASRTAAASCMSGPRTHATTTALFDNVMVNP